LDKGSVPLVPDEDGPAINATTTPATGRNGGTYNTPSKCAHHHQHNAHPLQVRIYQCDFKLRQWPGRWPIPVRGHFGRRAPLETPASWLKRSPSEGRSSGHREWGGGVTSAYSSSWSSSSLSPPEDSDSEGVSSHCPLVVTHNHSLWTRLVSRLAMSLGKMTPHGVRHAYMRSCAKKNCAFFF
jgi:hypothetical protein